LAFNQAAAMMRLALLIALAGALFLMDYFFGRVMGLHPDFMLMIGFFAIQTFVLFRLDQLAPKDYVVHVGLVKIGFRFLSALGFTLMLYYRNPTTLNTVLIQFVLLYLTFLIFEISTSLANLRRN
jgi:hypothetical protein